VAHIWAIEKDNFVPHGLVDLMNNYFAEMCSGSGEGSHLRLIDFGITQLYASE